VRKQKNIEIKVCDFCGSDEMVHDTCLGCGKDVCYECSKRVGEDYHHAVGFSGSGDGYFCNDCNQNPPKKLKKLHQLYKKIRALGLESKAFYEDFRKRTDKTEAELKAEYSKVVDEE